MNQLIFIVSKFRLEQTKEVDTLTPGALSNDFIDLKSAEIPCLLRGFKTDLMAFGAIVFGWVMLKVA